ncbi:ABC transporter ATP-binding protein [Desulforamulus hydrothermalis]|nr:ABC transporter ATP-binding protein [Desulforamulus hydrothermalis]SHH14257.1 ABC-type nitrate/sulfonate/bicarbonate transport system, ATPase component [Desulforamulus hydrothermalis Lam5 = DSM 18033]
MPAVRLAVKAVSKSYDRPGRGKILALDRVSLTVGEGEFVSLIGPSGCGKSTLLELVAGLARPDQGDILLQGRSVAGCRGHVSYMPQNDVLFPWRTVLDNVILPLQLQGMATKEARQTARQLLPLFGLAGFADSYPHMLSGGMKQRAAFLRTYLCRQELMLLDEPFGKLDALTKIQMQEWLLDIWQRFQHSVLFVTHDIEEAILLSDRIYLFSPRPGRILAELTVTLPRPRSPRLTTDRAFIKLKETLYSRLQTGFLEQEGEAP